MISGVVFDFNGTLFFDNDKHIKAWSRISQELRGTPITQGELLTRINGVPGKEIVAYLMGGVATSDQVEYYIHLKEEYYRDYCRSDADAFHLVAGAERLFDDLKQRGIPFTIASASIKENMDFFIESFGLDRWMDKQDIVFDDGSYSSKVAMFQKAVEIIGSPAGETLVFEDSASGLASALEVGVGHIVLVHAPDLAGREGGGRVRAHIDDFDHFDRALLGDA